MTRGKPCCKPSTNTISWWQKAKRAKVGVLTHRDQLSRWSVTVLWSTRFWQTSSWTLSPRQGGGTSHSCALHWPPLHKEVKLNTMQIQVLFEPIWGNKSFVVCPCSGGGGNFVLSSSLVGYTSVLGVVAPMVHHGYGFFYRINNERYLHWTGIP